MNYEKKLKNEKKLKRGPKRKQIEDLSTRQINRRYQEKLDSIIELIKNHPEAIVKTFDFSVDIILRNVDN